MNREALGLLRVRIEQLDVMRRLFEMLLKIDSVDFLDRLHGYYVLYDTRGLTGLGHQGLIMVLKSLTYCNSLQI